MATKRVRGSKWKNRKHKGVYIGKYIKPRGNRRFMLVPVDAASTTAKSHIFNSPQAAKTLGWAKA
jgi:hypothetical protein